jgi:hypothetical protein
MSLLDLFKEFMEEEEKTSQELEDKLKDNLHFAIINKLADIDHNIALASLCKPGKYEPRTVYSIPSSEHYFDINLAPYTTILNDFTQSITSLDDYLDIARISIRESAEAAKKGESALAAIIKIFKKLKVQYNKGDSVEAFIEKNVNNNNYLKLSDESQKHAQHNVDTALTIINERINEHKSKQDFFSPIEKTFNTAKNYTLELSKNLDLIIQIREDESNLELPVDKVDSILVELVYGRINRTSVTKKLNKLRDTKKDSTTSLGKTPENNQTTFVPKVAFFQNYKINELTMNQLLENKEKHDSAVYFLSNLETIFDDARLHRAQIIPIIQKNPSLLIESKGKMKDYLNSVEKLYELIEPIVVSGIKPSNNISIYSSVDSLNKVILKEQKKSKKINILNPELITNDKDRNMFKNRFNCAKLNDEPIRKYTSRTAGQKTDIYELFSSKFGEGTYMKGKVGPAGKGIIYKIEPTSETVNIRIINYFVNQNSQNDFLNLK